ncbi:MAG: Uma2 family endonuclease [Myxococcales bacterium]|nr:Uma2 family endonuclease [Myxococcales bacterium]
MATPAPRPSTIRPLVHGERVASWDEFLERWDATHRDKGVGLTDGVVRLEDPSVPGLPHGDFAAELTHWLASYAKCQRPHRSLRAGVEVIVRIPGPSGDRFRDSSVDPDVVLRSVDPDDDPDAGSFVPLESPELVVEVAYTSADSDLEHKQLLYSRAGVQEYLLVVLSGRDHRHQREVIWLSLQREGEHVYYERISPDADGVLTSRVFPDLQLDPEKLWRLEL